MWTLLFVFLIPGMLYHYHIFSCSTQKTRRENTVLRGQLYERSEKDTKVPEVRKSVYVIPNALVAEQFKPRVQPPTDTSMC